MERLQGMEIFVTVVDEGSFTAAAERLGCSKSYVSKQISALEDRLGARLLNRTTRSLALTDAGRAFHERATRIIADLDEAEHAVTQMQTTPRGRLRMSIPMSFGIQYLTPAIATFASEYPEIDIDVDFSDRKVDLIDEGFDLVVRIGELSDSSFMFRKIAPTRRFLCASPDYLASHGTPTHPRDLTEHDCLLYAYASTTNWQFQKDGETLHVPVDGRFRANNGHALLEAARNGLGIGIMPDFIGHEALASGELQAVLTEWNSWNAAVWVLYPHNRHLSAKVRAFVDFLADHFDPPPWASTMA